jgi:hypothetical protein
MPEAASSNPRLRAVSDFAGQASILAPRPARVIVGALSVAVAVPFLAWYLLRPEDNRVLDGLNVGVWLAVGVRLVSSGVRQGRRPRIADLLASPTVCFRQTRLEALADVAPFAALSIMGVHLLSQGNLIGGALCLLAAPVALFALVAVVMPPRLKIGPEGFAVVTFRGRKLTRWREAERFWSNDAPYTDSAWYLVTEFGDPSGPDKRLVDAYGALSGDDLAKLMNAAKARWG